MNYFCRCSIERTLFFAGLMLAAFLLLPNATHGANIIEYRDIISDSAPNEYSNHTIEFTTQVVIPAGGYVRVTPDDGDFTIVASTTIFGVRNVELLVDTGSGFVSRPAAAVADATYDGVAITRGTSSNIEITLNSSSGIPADADLRVLLGNHTSGSIAAASSTSSTTPVVNYDVGLLNPSASGTYEMNIEIGGSSSGSARALVAIVDSILFGPIDTRETDPPLRFNGAPMGELSGTTISVEMSLETNEFSECRYSTASGTPFASMVAQFDSSNSIFHSVLLLNLATSTTYTFFVRCIDDEGNFNTDDYVISFTVPEEPEGNPGGDDDTGDGTGTGDGSGSTGGGGGSSSGGGGGSSSGGGGGGSDQPDDSAGGGFDSTSNPYPSGEGRVIINGLAFPQSTIYTLVDGQIAETDNTSSDGSFSVTIDNIARGVYTFGIYAIDSNGTRSSTFSTTFTVTGSRGSTLSNINLMPSILISPEQVDPGGIVTLTGFSIPNSTITIQNQRDASGASVATLTSTSDASGAWRATINTSGYQRDTYKVRARSTRSDGRNSQFSGYSYYGVGEAPSGPLNPDLNRDGSVNLIDFSILLFWWGTDGGASDPPADINRDGRVTLTDFSIMIFNWTG